MKSTQEIIGLRIISISDGTQVGYIKDVVFNSKQGTLDFLIVDQPSDYFGAKVISFSDVTGLGEFALTIPDENVIQDVAQNEAIKELLMQNIRIIGTKVLTKSGQLSGEVQELLIDETTGKIAVCQVLLANGERYDIDASQVITYGKDLLIVENEQQAGNTSQVSAVNPGEQSLDQTNAKQPLVLSNQPPQDESNGFNLFEQRQLQYFVGKAVDKAIDLDTGEQLAPGEIITEETITKIKTRSTLMEITSHLRKQ